MVGPGINLATTRDGEAYNKLQRPPQDYLTSTAPTLPPTKPLPASASSVPSNKRKRYNTYETPGQKRSRIAQAKADGTSSLLRGAGGERARDADCGMKITLPGLDDEGFSSDDSTGDAIAYLRTVRSEASAIPHLLMGNTSTRPIHVSDGAGANFVFEQGTFIAVDDQMPAEDVTEKSPDSLTPQDRYYELLLKRFYHLRTTLDEARQRANASTSKTSATRKTPRTLREWSNTLEEDPPNIEHLVHLDEAAIYNGLQSCTRSMDVATAMSPRYSCWAWSLLALVPDGGTLSYEKIGHVREVGQSASIAAVRLRSGIGEDLGLQEQCDPQPGDTAAVHVEDDASDTEMSISADEGEVLTDTEDPDFARAKAGLLTQLGDRLVHPQRFSPQATKSRHSTAAGHDSRGSKGSRRSALPSVPSSTQAEAKENAAKQGSHHHQPLGTDAEGSLVDANTSVTIDMILTIVAECFGQKDLLAYRRRW